MSISSGLLLLVTIVYLVTLFGVALAAERGLIPKRITSHPATYVLALGVYASGFAYFGITGLAANYGIGYLNYFLGISVVFFMTPLLVKPIYQVCKTYRLSSIPDLLSFRYRSQTVGSLSSLILCLASLPLIALQIEVVAESAAFAFTGSLEPNSSIKLRNFSGLVFCTLIAIFTLLFGARSLNSRDNHRGLMAVLALESSIKLIALLALGLAAVFFVFNGLDGFSSFLNDPAQSRVERHADQNSLRIMFISFFGMALSLPSVFQVLYAENPSQTKLHIASWGLPLFLLAMSLPIAPILWAAESRGYHGGDYAVLFISQIQGSQGLALLAFIGGLSAASGAIVVNTLSLASTLLSHQVLPLIPLHNDRRDVYQWLLRARQLLIVLIILLGYLLYLYLPQQHQLSDLVLLTATGCSQLGPAILGVLYWPSANNKGVSYGIVAGGSIWLAWLCLPTIGLPVLPDLQLAILQAPSPELSWVPATTLSIVVNGLVFMGVSMLTQTSTEEQAAAATCNIDDLNRPGRNSLNLHSAQEIGERLSQTLGQMVAEHELNRALNDLELDWSETRPYALRRLRDRIEANLSGLLGPSIARRIIDTSLPYSHNNIGENEDITYIETRLESYETSLTGLAADLDSLRRYHRHTLENLPIGVCSLGADQEILLWNITMAEISHIDSEQVLGSSVLNLPSSWADCLLSFSSSSDYHWSRYQLSTGHGALWLNLHKTESHSQGRDELLIVVEDITDTQLLENELTHQERLASIGRLAAGVAHEIGNPVTGIACLAQNLRYDSDNPETLDSAEQIIKQTRRITTIVQSLVNFAHTGHSNQGRGDEAVNIQHCASDAIQLLSLDREARKVQFENLCDPELNAHADNQRMVQVFINLLSNARDASPSGGRVTIHCQPSPAHADKLLISVSDCGQGIDPALQAQLFEPFFTTKEPGKGTGLGLALVYNIIQDFEGSISITSPLPELPRGGTRVEILLPLATPAIGDKLDG